MALSLAEYRQKYPQYDDIDDSTLAQALHKKYYSSMRWEDFSARVMPKAGQPTSTQTSEFGQGVLDSAAQPRQYDIEPSIEELSQGPARDAYVKEKGTHAQQAAKMRGAEIPEFTERQQRDRDFLTQKQLLAERGESSEDLLKKKGAMMRRLIDLDIYQPEHYYMSDEQFEAVTQDKVTEEMRVKKEASDAAEGQPPSEVSNKADRGWWAFTKKAVGSIPSQITAGLELNKDTAERIAQQDIRLGQLYLEGIEATFEGTGEGGKKIVEAAAEKHGMDPESYAKYTAQMVDMLTDNERSSLGRYADIIDEVQSVRPETEGWLGHIAAMGIENVGQLGYIAAGVATRNPVITMSLMGTDIYARTYANARSEGRDPNEASQDAFFSTMVEGATEAVPVSKFIGLMKAGQKSRARKLLEGLGTEASQEMLAEAAQIGYDIGVIGDDMTMGEAAGRLRDAGVLGAAMGGIIAAPVAAFGDNDMANAQSDIDAAKKRLGALAMQVQNPNARIKKADIDAAKKDYASAVKAKGDLILKRKEAEAEKKKAKGDKKEAKRKAKLTPKEQTREAAAEVAEKADQAVKGLLTDEDLQMAEWLEKAGRAELDSSDVNAVEAMMDAGYLKITKAGTPVVLDSGKRRLKAVRAAQEGMAAAPVEDEVIEPVPYERPGRADEMAAVDEEIGRRMRDEQVIEPKPYTSPQGRRAAIDAKVDAKIQDPAVREKIINAIVKAEEIESAISERQEAEARRIEEQRDQDYDKALGQVTEVELDVAKNLAMLDEKGVSGYKGTRLGDVLRNAMNVLEKQEAAAKKALEDAFWNKPVQGQLFDVSGVFIKGTKDYANLVKVGALKLAKHGLKYSAWTADMIGEFGENIKPVMARVFHDAKKSVQDVMRLSHEKFPSGKRKGELRFAPKDYAKPGAIRKLRNTLAKLAKEGAEGRMWYEKSGKEILKITGGNVALGRKLAGLFAIYSSGTAVGANTTNALKMWAQYMGTKKLVQPKKGTMAGRFSEQDRTAIAWLNSKESDEHFVESFGNKRYPFYLNIMREVDPANYEAGQGVTVDLWMMRAFGYDQDAPTDAQYAFAGTEIKALADKLGWEKQQVQAAVWVAIKARWEYVQKQAKARAVEQGLAEMGVGAKGAPMFDVLGSTREEQIANEKKIIMIFRNEALKVSIKEINKKLDESKADFADYLANHYATVSWEAEPSTQLGSNLNKLSLEDKLAMQADMAELMVNPETGREYIAEWLQLLGQDQIVGPGAWEMNIGAAVQNSVIVPVMHKPGKTKAAQKEAASAMDGYAAIMGYLMKQDGVAWHKPFYSTTLKAANGVEVLNRGILSQEQTLKFYEAMYAATGNMDFAPIVLNNATRVLNFTTMPNRDFHKMVAAAADAAGVAGDIEVFQSDGNLVMNDWKTNKKGQEYVEAINNSENPRVKKAFARAKRKFTRDIEAIYAKYSGEKTDARPSVTAVTAGTKLKRVPKGHLRFRHFGKVATGTLSVEKFGTGIKGAERARGSMPVISAYPNKGFTKEVGLGSNEYVIDVPRDQMYDANADKLGLKERAQETSSFKMVKGKKVPVNTRLDMNKFEQLIKDEGFVGYHTPKAEGNLKGQARFFQSLVVDDAASKTPVQEKEAPTFSLSSRPRVTVVENEFDEFEVREKDGEIYYTDDPDDAINTARSIHGLDTDVTIVDEDGEVITVDKGEKTPARIKLKGFGAKPTKDDSEALSEFLDDWIELTQANPLSPDERVVDGVAAVELRPMNNFIYLDSIRSFEKGAGGGSKALKQIVELADMHGVMLKMIAKPFETGGNELQFNDLVKWYERNGFVKDWQERGYGPSASMHRMPQVVKKPFVALQLRKGKKPSNYGMSVEQAEAYINEHFAKFYDLTNIKAVASYEDLPFGLYAQLEELGYGDRIKGVFHDHQTEGPTIYIVANNQYISDFQSPRYSEPDLEGMIETVLHETIGHFGLQALLGDKYDKMMDLIIRDMPMAVKYRGQEMGPGLHNRRTAAEEVVAYLAGEILNGRKLKNNQSNILGRIINAIKIALAEMGIRKLTQDDLVNLIFRAAHYTKNTPQALMQKRARMVRKMKLAQVKIDSVSIVEATGPELSISDMKALPEGELVFIDTEEGGKQVFLDGKNIGYILPTVSDEVLRASPGIQSWSQAGSKSTPTRKKITETFSIGIGLKQARKDDPALDRFMAKIGHSHNSRLTAMRDWWEARKGNIKRAFEIEVLDQFAGIKHMEEELNILAGDSGYKSVRLTAGTDVIIRSAIERGVPMWDADGSVRTDHTTEGLLQVLAPIAQNAEMLKAFEAFLVARRARRLKKENRERLFEREEIGAALKFIRKKKLYGMFKQTADDLANYKSKVLDFAQEAGLIDPVSRKLWEHHDHVPFYRVLAENTKGPFYGSRIGHIGKVIHRLKGGTDPLKHPLEAITQNLSMLIEASVKNRATADVINNFDGTGVITKAPQAEMTTALIPLQQVKDMLFENGVSLDAVGQDLLDGVQKLMALQAPTADNVISVQEEGKKQYYYIHDAGVMRGLDNVSPTQWIWLMKFLRMPKRILTRSITLMPDFILKNWFRDIWHAYALNRHGNVLPVYDSARGWARAIVQDETYQDIMSGGGMFDSGYVNASDPKKTKTAIRRGVLAQGRHNVLDTPTKLARFYMRIANGAENAHRIIVYEKTLKKTGSRKQALFEARDLMDFSVRGANPIVRFLTETVPFWGARVQGIARTGKGFSETPATLFMRALPIVVASMALYVLNRDDERFKGLNPYEKRMYYHFYDVFEIGDHYRLPKPFEVGAIFSTIPEIITENMLSTESDRNRQAMHSFAWTVKEMLSLMPDVQALNPVYELLLNENRFTEAPIISDWEEQLDPKDRYSYRTNATIRELAQYMPEGAPEWMRSPKQLEHLVRGYLGSAMDYALVASDMIFEKELNGGVASPALRWDETPFAKSFKREPHGKYDMYLDSMYDVLDKANKIHNSINKNKKLPKSAERDARIQRLREENEALMYARGPMNKASKDVSKINKHIKKVYADDKMTPEQKRAEIDVLLRKRSEAAQKVYEYRPGGKLNKFEGKGDREASYYEQITNFLNGLEGKTKDEQVDELISAQLPHTATLINDITISDEKLRSLV